MKKIFKPTSILYCVFLLTLIEFTGFASYLILKDKIFFLDDQQITAENKDNLSKVFDSQLGWKASKARSKFSKDQNIFCFGDSFTYGDEVEKEKSWPAQLENISGKKVFNGGVKAFGIDQAVLKFRQHSDQLENKVVILGYITNNFFRALNVYRPFLSPKSKLRLTKPRFNIDPRTGEIGLLANPLKKSSEIQKLNDFNFLSKISKNDFWFQTDPPLTASLPYSRLFIQAKFWQQISNLITQDHSKPGSEVKVKIYNKSWFKKLQTYIVNIFFTESKKKSNRGILVHFPMDHEVKIFQKEKKIPNSLSMIKTICNDKKVECLFPLTDMPFFQKLSTEEEFRPGGHYSPHLNEKIAEYLREKLGLE